MSMHEPMAEVSPFVASEEDPPDRVESVAEHVREPKGTGSTYSPSMSADPVDIPSPRESLGAEPLHVRDPEVVRALADAVAILGPDLRPRIMLGRLGGFTGATGMADMGSRIADWVHRDDLGLVRDALERSRLAPSVDIPARVRVHNDHDGWHDMTLVFRNLLEHPDVREPSCGPSTRPCSTVRRGGEPSWARARSASSRSISTTAAPSSIRRSPG